MKTYQVYYMRRHIPPEGSVHVAADRMGTVQGTSRRDALAAAKGLFPNLKNHIAVEMIDDRT